jgi:hypothetical protein
MALARFGRRILHPSDPSSDRGRGVPFPLPSPSSPHRPGCARSFRCASCFRFVLSEPHPLEYGSIGVNNQHARPEPRSPENSYGIRAFILPLIITLSARASKVTQEKLGQFKPVVQRPPLLQETPLIEMGSLQAALNFATDVCLQRERTRRSPLCCQLIPRRAASSPRWSAFFRCPGKARPSAARDGETQGIARDEPVRTLEDQFVKFTFRWSRNFAWRRAPSQFEAPLFLPSGQKDGTYVPSLAT